jgi:hypothetical protein
MKPKHNQIAPAKTTVLQSVLARPATRALRYEVNALSNAGTTHAPEIISQYGGALGVHSLKRRTMRGVYADIANREM